MTHKDTDLRIRRTHKLLHDALMELIAEKGFDAITVGEIAERAMATTVIHVPAASFPRQL